MNSGIPVFDIDTHWTEPKDLWTSRAPAKFKDRVLHVRTNQIGHDYWHLESQVINFAGPQVITVDGTKARGMTTLTSMAEMGASGTEPKARLRAMDAMGVHTQIVYPNVVGFGAAKLMKIGGRDDGDLRLFHVQAYNDAIAQLQADGEGRLLPLAVLPLWDLDLSIQEMERCRERLGLAGIVMSDRPADFGQKPLHHPSWGRFFSACEALDYPINFHIGSGEDGSVLESYWGEKEFINADGTFNGPLAAYLSVSLFLANFRDLVNIVLTGMPDRYPKLKFVSVESGVGWIPFILQSLEYTFQEMMTAKERGRFRKSPTEYFLEHFYAAYWFEDARSVAEYIDRYGADNLLFETDFPHPQGLYPDIHAKVDETLGRFDRSIREKVLYRNAEKVYGVTLS
ncbi:MAG: amidohydrolase family protein [Gammaproteobacteria bacterium]